MKEVSKNQAIENVISELLNGNSVPSASLGNGGAGYEGIQLGEEAAEAFREQLEEAEYVGEVSPAEDFGDFVEVSDYAHCVEFRYSDGMRQQFLLDDDAE